MSLNDETNAGLERWRESLGDLLDVLQEVPGSRSIDELRAGYITMLKGHPTPDGLDVSVITMGGIPGRIVKPSGTTPRRAIVYFHGGAYIFGGSEGYVALAGRLALNTGAAVYIPDYRLAPEHPFPVPIQDSFEAYRWVLSQGFTANNIAFAGDSAGGALTVSVMVMARDAGIPLPAAGVRSE